MNRRDFLYSSAALALASSAGVSADSSPQHHFPEKLLRRTSYIEEIPVPEYHHAPQSAYEAFRDMKFGVRIHWGIYSIWHRGRESWPFLDMSFADRQQYQQLYKTWNPTGFDAGQWMDLFHESGMKMFAFTSKHHEGFSMFDTKTRVRQRANWIAPGGPVIESCDLTYSIMETPFRRDVVKELCDAAHKRGIKIDLYFSHPDWYDADFRPYVYDPLQVPSSLQLTNDQEVDEAKRLLGDRWVTAPDPTPEQATRMMARHRAQLVELLTNYGTIDMVCLDMWLGRSLWPELRKTILQLRRLQPNVMFRDRGIGNYGDYYTPERVVPGDKQAADAPWFVIYPLGTDFSYEVDAAKHKGTEWIVHNLVDSVAKGGGFMVGVGPSASGEFHPEAQRQLRTTGDWLKINGEGIFNTRPRDSILWSEGDTIRYTRSKDGRWVYAFSLRWPAKELLLTSVRPLAGSEIHLLGYPGPLQWSYDSSRGLAVSLPNNLQDATRQAGQFAWAFKIEAENG
ncbi:MAG TPA: alpha-L-fucosidase [Candidatus Sulfotelmatobacter sp.]|nr:alpha-L-fucosidase [Candidatus Sulfotelmatobacter sp.]